MKIALTPGHNRYEKHRVLTFSKLIGHICTVGVSWVQDVWNSVIKNHLSNFKENVNDDRRLCMIDTFAWHNVRYKQQYGRL